METRRRLEPFRSEPLGGADDAGLVGDQTVTGTPPSRLFTAEFYFADRVDRLYASFLHEAMNRGFAHTVLFTSGTERQSFVDHGTHGSADLLRSGVLVFVADAGNSGESSQVRGWDPRGP